MQKLRQKKQSRFFLTGKWNGGIAQQHIESGSLTPIMIPSLGLHFFNDCVLFFLIWMNEQNKNKNKKITQ